MSALRILHAVRSDGFGGVEQFVLRLAGAQAAAGHSVHVIGGDPTRMEPGLRTAGVGHTATRDTALAVARAVSSRAVSSRVVSSRADAVDVVNSHMTAADLAAAWALARICEAPALVSTRHFASPRGRIGGVSIDTLLGRRIRAEISISHAVARAIGRPSTVVHSGVPDAPMGVARGATVLIAQRLEAEKRTDLGIRAFAASGLAERGWTLEIAGDGAERGTLEDLARTLGVPVTFFGFRSDLPSLFAHAGMLVAPCPVEGLGLTVLEAMSVGLPVIAANGGGHTEILEGLDPRALYTPEDPDAAAVNLRSLADDGAGRATLGTTLRERQRADFSLAAQVARTDAVYRGVLGFSRRPTAQ